MAILPMTVKLSGILFLSVLSFAAAGAQPQLPAGPSNVLPCRELKIEGPVAGASPVQWISPSEGVSTLNGWCGTVGPARLLAPGQQLTPRGGRTLVVSWNMHVGNGNLEELIREVRLSERAEGHGEPDFVFLLQEAFSRSADIPSDAPDNARVPDRINGVSADLPELARKLGFWMYYVPSMRNGSQAGEDAQDRGNAIFSSLPLEALHAIELPFFVQRRVSLAATVHHPGNGRRFRVAVTHLDTRAPMMKGFIFGAPSARNRQAQWLVRTLGTLQDDGLPLIMGGDLNTHFGSLESAVDTLSHIAPRIQCSPAPTHASGLTLDYLFAQPAVTRTVAPCKRLNSRFDSDHYPLVLPVDPEFGERH
jgi:endonuclease/exonuclease/phosphatase family metal-dependent hydrolase